MSVGCSSSCLRSKAAHRELRAARSQTLRAMRCDNQHKHVRQARNGKQKKLLIVAALTKFEARLPVGRGMPCLPPSCNHCREGAIVRQRILLIALTLCQPANERATQRDIKHQTFKRRHALGYVFLKFLAKLASY